MAARGGSIRWSDATRRSSGRSTCYQAAREQPMPRRRDSGWARPASSAGSPPGSTAGRDVASLDDRIVIELDPTALLGGTGVRGALAERIVQIKTEVVRSEGRIVVFFDEIHALFGGEAGEEAANSSRWRSRARGAPVHRRDDDRGVPAVDRRRRRPRAEVHPDRGRGALARGGVPGARAGGPRVRQAPRGALCAQDRARGERDVERPLPPGQGPPRQSGEHRRSRRGARAPAAERPR